MWASAVACAANQANLFTASYILARFDENTAHMSIECGKTIAVVDDNIIAIAGIPGPAAC